MRVAEHIILDALTRGGCIKTFWRISSRQAAESSARIPEGYILESPGAGRYRAQSCRLSCAGEAAGAEGNVGAGGRRDLFWWGNLAAESRVRVMSG
jgi:hypothetical protein